MMSLPGGVAGGAVTAGLLDGTGCFPPFGAVAVAFGAVVTGLAPVTEAAASTDEGASGTATVTDVVPTEAVVAGVAGTATAGTPAPAAGASAEDFQTTTPARVSKPRAAHETAMTSGVFRLGGAGASAAELIESDVARD